MVSIEMKQRKIILNNLLPYILTLDKECLTLAMKHVKLGEVRKTGVIHLLFSLVVGKLVVEIGEEILSKNGDQEIYVPEHGCFHVIKEFTYYNDQKHYSKIITMVAASLSMPRPKLFKILVESAPLRLCKGIWLLEPKPWLNLMSV